MNLFFDDTATTEIYALSLHDALPIFVAYVRSCAVAFARGGVAVNAVVPGVTDTPQLEIDARAAGVSRAAIVERRSGEHKSELQSRQYLVWRLPLEKKNDLLPLRSTLL